MDKIKAPPERVEKSQIKPAKTLRVSGWKRWGSKWLDQTLGLFQKAGSEGTANPKRRKPPRSSRTKAWDPVEAGCSRASHGLSSTKDKGGTRRSVTKGRTVLVV